MTPVYDELRRRSINLYENVQLFIGSITDIPNFTIFKYSIQQCDTRNSSGDEIANVNFLYDDIVHAVKIQ